MPNLINDNSLIGFWPLHEPSGTPSWKNYAPQYGNHPSGLSFDMLVHTTHETMSDEDAQSTWPGQDSFIQPFSGVLIKGLKLQGQQQRRSTTTPAPFSNILVMGHGTQIQRDITLSAPVANSGFTAGLWVYPTSDGWLTAQQDGGFSIASDGWQTGYGRLHGLMAQFNDDIGWFLGVSGALSAATPVSDNEFGLHQLRAYVMSDQNAGFPDKIDTPIESGRYTHLTMSYRYVDGTNNEIVLYKDGRLAASGTTDREITLDSSKTVGPDSSVLSIGAGTDMTASTTDNYRYGSGWGHLVSGAYHFRRVLDEGEILEMHERGGLQPDFSLRDNVTPVTLNDDDLVAYVECRAPGWIDASKNHNNFASEKDPGDRALGFTWSPGPFNTNRPYNDSASNGFDYIVAPSGATFDVAQGPGGFTICGFFQPFYLSNDRDGSMMMSMGSISSATVGAASNTVSTNTLGLMLSYFFVSGPGDRIGLEVFPVGDFTDGALIIRNEGEQMWKTTCSHYGIIYDRATQGIALYMDGYEAASGTLTHDLQAHMLSLAGSGFPVMFTNGFSNQIGDNSTSKGVLANGGQDLSSGPYAMFSRPLRADEMRFMAQSGIDTSPLWRTRYDPRLMGYWPCSTSDLGDVTASDDVAMAMAPIVAPMVRGDTDTKWQRAYNNFGGSISDPLIFNNGDARVDLFTGETRTPVPELASFGNLGISSGCFSPHGASACAGGLGNNTDSQNSAFNAIMRYMPCAEETDLGPQNLNEYLISFEVTPSGNIPALEATSNGTSTTQRWFNSRLHTHGNIENLTTTTAGEVASFLTTINEGLGSGVTICFVSRVGSTTTNITPIVSGTLPFGVPSKVLFHVKFDEPNRVEGFLAGNTPVTASLWIDGQKINQRTDTSNNLRLWSNQIPNGSTSDWSLQFGGSARQDTFNTNVLVDGGLGEIYMREIFLMRGTFLTGEVEALAVSGVQSPTIAGYAAQLPTTQVTIADSALEGYWRFNGFDGNVGQVSNTPGGSGTTDLSLKGNHLDAIGQRAYEDAGHTAGAWEMQGSMRALPGPLRNSDLGVQCSGFHHQAIRPGNQQFDMAPPHAVSGAAFNAPQDGFSVGFLLAKREESTNAAFFQALMTYGVLTDVPNGSDQATDFNPDRGWTIGMTDNENMRMVLSTGGSMHLSVSAVAQQSGQVMCGPSITTNALSDLREFNNYEHGDFQLPGLDHWSHYCWTYDPSPAGGSGVRCYLNGVLVDEQFIQADNSDGTPRINPWTGRQVAPQVPVSADARMISFRSPMSTTVWDFRQNSIVDIASVPTDVFYFSRPLTQAEVRYIAQNGIDDAVGIETSGVTGGFIHGQDTGSGHIGGFSFGQDTGSGLIGGFMPGGLEGSGLFGGYVSGVVFADGTIGGWIRGQDDMSGILGGYMRGVDVGSGSIAGYIAGQDVGSGHFGGLIFAAEIPSGLFGGYMRAADIASGVLGGFMLGGLQGNFEFDAGFTVDVLAARDFDAQLEIAKTVSSDFDAKVIIFQDEIPPLVDIIVPDASVSGLMPPFNQYFVAKASGQQGKTITSTKWTFGDLTPSVTVAESGAGCYPTQHLYASSGFFIAKFEATDSDGLHASATRIINAASGIDPVLVSLSGVPRSGDAELIVDFTTTVDILPPGVSIITQLLNYDDGQTTISFNPTHNYTQPGTYKPIWCVRDSRGIIWCDSLEAGNDFLESGGA